jgi:hypothetical protein
MEEAERRKAITQELVRTPPQSASINVSDAESTPSISDISEIFDENNKTLDGDFTRPSSSKDMDTHVSKQPRENVLDICKVKKELDISETRLAEKLNKLKEQRTSTSTETLLARLETQKRTPICYQSAESSRSRSPTESPTISKTANNTKRPLSAKGDFDFEIKSPEHKARFMRKCHLESRRKSSNRSANTAPKPKERCVKINGGNLNTKRQAKNQAASDLHKIDSSKGDSDLNLQRKSEIEEASMKRNPEIEETYTKKKQLKAAATTPVEHKIIEQDTSVDSLPESNVFRTNDFKSLPEELCKKTSHGTPIVSWKKAALLNSGSKHSTTNQYSEKHAIHEPLEQSFSDKSAGLTRQLQTTQKEPTSSDNMQQQLTSDTNEKSSYTNLAVAHDRFTKQLDSLSVPTEINRLELPYTVSKPSGLSNFQKFIGSKSNLSLVISPAAKSNLKRAGLRAHEIDPWRRKKAPTLLNVYDALVGHAKVLDCFTHND